MLTQINSFQMEWPSTLICSAINESIFCHYSALGGYVILSYLLIVNGIEYQKQV